MRREEMKRKEKRREVNRWEEKRWDEKKRDEMRSEVQWSEGFRGVYSYVWVTMYSVGSTVRTFALELFVLRHSSCVTLHSIKVVITLFIFVLLFDMLCFLFRVFSALYCFSLCTLLFLPTAVHSIEPMRVPLFYWYIEQRFVNLIYYTTSKDRIIMNDEWVRKWKQVPPTRFRVTRRVAGPNDYLTRA
jgi:hypothetical protein